MRSMRDPWKRHRIAMTLGHAARGAIRASAASPAGGDNTVTARSRRLEMIVAIEDNPHRAKPEPWIKTITVARRHNQEINGSPRATRSASG
jgi:hypothetical protein